mmetsp:Transcript_13551/g.25947  ORF Transcript_13551/g.25947 Transcript_13551/m.25947 type:complete len:253 (+) Transcript_13551:1298-2056(+)
MVPVLLPRDHVKCGSKVEKGVVALPLEDVELPFFQEGVFPLPVVFHVVPHVPNSSRWLLRRNRHGVRLPSPRHGIGRVGVCTCACPERFPVHVAAAGDSCLELTLPLGKRDVASRRDINDGGGCLTRLVLGALPSSPVPDPSSECLASRDGQVARRKQVVRHQNESGSGFILLPIVIHTNTSELLVLEFVAYRPLLEGSHGAWNPDSSSFAILDGLLGVFPGRTCHLNTSVELSEGILVGARACTFLKHGRD